MDPYPAWRGTSVGYWEGDTLVIESVGFDGKARLDSTRNPNSEQLKVTERLSFIDADQIRLDVAIDDPVNYTRQFTNIRTFLRMDAGDQLYEFVCGENNRCVDGECTPADVQRGQA